MQNDTWNSLSLALMESQLFQCNIRISSPANPRHTEIAKQFPIVRSALISRTDSAKKIQNLKIKQNDNWLDSVAIKYLSGRVQDTTGLRNDKNGYESLVEGAAMASRNFDPSQQRQLVVKSLENAIPWPILAMIRTMLPNSKFKREIFAIFTMVSFKWLVGPCEVRESEFKDKIERNVVHINKCRFLEESNCVGMCINLCKIPTQTFIKDSMGMPINMVPNFEDMSCDMIFGQNPPLPAEDPVFKQPCYRQCKEKQKHSTNCSN